MEERSGNKMNIWIQGWKEAGALLEETRRARLMDLDIRQVIECLDDAFESALLHTPARSHSGLVEMQAWFAKARP